MILAFWTFINIGGMDSTLYRANVPRGRVGAWIRYVCILAFRFQFHPPPSLLSTTYLGLTIFLSTCQVIAGLPGLLPTGIAPFFNIDLYVPSTNKNTDKKKKKVVFPTIAVNVDVVETQHVEISQSKSPPPCITPPPRGGGETQGRGKRRMKTSDLQILRFLGEGTNGQVCLAVDRESKIEMKVALKAILNEGECVNSLRWP